MLSIFALRFNFSHSVVLTHARPTPVLCPSPLFPFVPLCHPVIIAMAWCLRLVQSVRTARAHGLWELDAALCKWQLYKRFATHRGLNILFAKLHFCRSVSCGSCLYISHLNLAHHHYHCLLPRVFSERVRVVTTSRNHSRNKPRLVSLWSKMCQQVRDCRRAFWNVSSDFAALSVPPGWCWKAEHNLLDYCLPH